MAEGNRIAEIGFGLALVAVAGLFLVGRNDAALYLAFLGLPATIFSLIGLVSMPRRWAWWGLGVGFFVCLHLPTLALAFRK